MGQTDFAPREGRPAKPRGPRRLSRALKSSLAVGLAAGALTAFLAPSFHATAALNLPATQGAPVLSDAMLREVAAQVGFKPDGISASARFGALFGLSAEAVAMDEDDRAVEAIRQATSVRRSNDVLTISVSDDRPQRAAALANAVAEASTGASASVSSLMQRTLAAQAAAEALAAYRETSGYPATGAAGESDIAQLDAAVARAAAGREALDAAAEALDGANLAGIPDEVMTAGLSQALSEQGDAHAEVAELSKTLLDGHPRMRAAKMRLVATAANVGRETRLAAEALDARRDEAGSAETAARAALEQAQSLAGRERQDVRLAELTRTSDDAQVALAAIDDPQANGTGITMLNRATAPTFPELAQPAKAAGAGFLGSAFLMGAASLFRRRAPKQVSSEPKQTIEPLAEMPPPPEPAEVAPISAEPGSAVAEFDVVGVAELLISGGVERAIFVSPQGDDAAAVTVLVAREIADAGLRVLLLDLTAAGAASGPMLDDEPLPGITDLLAGEARLSDVVHDDRYSQCFVMPVGTADPARAVRAIDRLPVIVDALTDAYDLVIAECGPANADGISRLVGPATRVFVTVLEAGAELLAEAEALRQAGHADVALVSPAGYAPPSPGQANRTLL